MRITKIKLKQIILEEYTKFLKEDWRTHRLTYEPKPDNYRSELMQHLIDKEGMDENEAGWAANEMEGGRSIVLDSGINYSSDQHFSDTYTDWQDEYGKEKPIDVDPTIKPPDTSSIAPQYKRLYGSDIHGYQTHMTESVPK